MSDVFLGSPQSSSIHKRVAAVIAGMTAPTIKWVTLSGLNPSLTYRFQIEKVAPRRARTLLAEGPIRNLRLPRQKPPRAFGQNPFDQSGHLIGHRFGGPNRRANIVAMHGLANLNPGTWYVLEDAIAELIGAGTGTMRVSVRYHESSLLRPIAFHVEARSPSGEFRTWQVPNWNPHLPNPKQRQQLEAEAEKLADES